MNLVKQSLWLCIGALLALIGVTGFLSLGHVSSLAQASRVVANASELVVHAEQLEESFGAARVGFRDAIEYTNLESLDAARGRFQENVKSLQTDIDRVAKDVSDSSGGLGHSPELIAHFESTRTAVKAWLSRVEPYLTAGSTTALPALHEVVEGANGVTRALQNLMDLALSEGNSAVTASEQTAAFARMQIFGAVLIAVLIGGSLGWFAMRSLHRQLGGDASSVAAISRAIAQGDLTVHIPMVGVPEQSVMADMARMRDALVGTVSRVRAISASVDLGVQEIAAGNHDLSQRTELQASALNRTTNTMQTLVTQMNGGADQADQGYKRSGEASRTAEAGGVVVQQVVATMREIEASARRIGDIIGVIDGIAFQTNILALNAAVEAARAGEQGRGFAVVAGEVRSLAQRSAGAAREIKELIADSVGKVAQGVGLVDQAGNTMTGVVDSIRQVAGMMESMQNAARQQIGDVRSLDGILAEMDEQTRGSAALAEQTSAATEALRGQSTQLMEVVGFFRVVEGQRA